ncbi:MAG: urease accessory protein UreF, partial [Desulfuromonadales bacterium]|nr:urease accessory protein UreF [Desulfuromonadales bacterium]
MTDKAAHLTKLLQLVSPALPTGAFSYSQGLEWAVEAGWVRDADGLADWLRELLQRTMIQVDLPLLRLMTQACRNHDRQRLDSCCSLLLACRESREIREEEGQRGRAMAVLLAGLGMIENEDWQRTLVRSQLAGFAYAAQTWGIPDDQAATGYLWSWLENQVITGVKLIPLGQTAGQRLLLLLGGDIHSIALEG